MFFNFFKRKNTSANQIPKIGLTLSGGGMRGIAHIGIIKAFEEYGLRPQVLSGTSMGAIVGAFYAYGYPPDQMFEIATSGKYFNRKNFRLGTTGLFKNRMILQLLQKHIPQDSFEHLKIPLYICATELCHGRTEYFSSGALHQRILASASIPYIFPPVRIGENLYTDGGVTNNLPIEPILDQCNFLIGSHVNSIVYDEMNNINARSMFGRILHLALGTTVYAKIEKCDLFIDPVHMTQFGIFDDDAFQTMFDCGYHHTKSTLEKHGFTKGGDVSAILNSKISAE